MIKRKVRGLLIAFTFITCAVVPAQNASATDYGVAQAATSVGVVTASSGLNLRASASTSARVILTIPYNAKVNVQSTSSGWYYVEYNGSYGYVSSSYVTISNGSTSSGSSSQVGQITATSGLNLRSSASTSASVLTVIPYNAKVNIKSSSSGWYYVEYNGYVGYVSSSYVTLTSGGTTSGGTSSGGSTSQSGQITATSGLNLRSSASTSASVITTIPYNAKVTIKSTLSGWYYVDYNGRLGYVSSSYVKITTGSTSGDTTQSSKYEQVLSIMKSQIGSPYVYGGSGQFITDSLISSLRNSYPSINYDLIGRQYYNSGYRAFDCSGLMQWSFAQVGITLGRTTYGQIENGSYVSVSNAKPGDLLINSSKNHVGMYIGNDQWIESPSSGKFIRISNVPWSSIGYARRVL